MPQLQNPYRLWLLLFTLGIGLDTLGIALTGPAWLRYGLIGSGVLLFLLSIALIGRLQRSKP
jgi:hypothetical protein